MTTPPKARLYRLSRDESVLARARGDRPAPPQPADNPAAGVRVELLRGKTARAQQAAQEPARGAPDRADGRSEPPLRAAPSAAAPSRGAPPAAGPAPRPPAQPVAQQPGDALFAPSSDGFEGMAFPGSAAAAARTVAASVPAQPAGPSTATATATGAPASPPADTIASVKAENLTQRQLRMASRIAAMNGIEVASDHDAVIKLRARGIDPFHRESVGQVLSQEGARARNAPAANIPALAPQTAPARTGRRDLAPIVPPQLPSREEMTEDRRAIEIMKIQRDLARRRRRRLGMLIARLSVMVVLPTILAGIYYFAVATPLYATKSQFLIQQADSGGVGGAGGLLSGTQLATNPDSVSVQSYLNSRAAMLRLDEDKGFKRTFQDPSVDPILRLPEDASNEAAYKIYQDMVKIGYDPTEGVINLEVISPDPELSQEFTLALIGYAEGQVDQMTARLRADQMEGADKSYQDAEARVLEAQERVQALQQRMGVLDPVAEGSAVMSQVTRLEGELTEKRLELGQLQANARPNQSRVVGVQGDIERLQQMIAETRSQLTQDTGNRASLAAISGEIRIAESDLETRQTLLAGAAEQMESARLEANKQVRYLSMSLPPVAADTPTYPKAFQNTIVAFLIFAALYLMLSLTASILREQVSS